MADETKRCGKCETVKPVAQFSPRGKGRSGYQSWCKPCLGGYSTRRSAAKVRERLGLPPDFPNARGVATTLPIGTRRVHRGYVLVKAPDHHRADRHGWVYEHIVAAEQKYGITITRDFTVHHINGDRADNRPENLDLRFGNHGKGADVLPGLLRDPAMRKVARAVLSQYNDLT